MLFINSITTLFLVFTFGFCAKETSIEMLTTFADSSTITGTAVFATGTALNGCSDSIHGKYIAALGSNNIKW